MIRRLWRWLGGDVEYDALQKTARDLADVINAMTPEQQARAYLNHGELWWHANMVAACANRQRR